MTTSLKDVSTAQMIHGLTEINAFEKEHMIWGYAWASHDGTIFFRMNEDRMILRQARDSLLRDGIAVTPLENYTERANVRREEYDDWVYARKLLLAENLRESYSKPFFCLFRQLLEGSGDSAAMDVLLQWRSDIAGYFDKTSLTLFEGALMDAFRKMHISPNEYQMFHTWLQQELSQVLDEPVSGKTFKRDFYATLYWEDEIKRFLVNANADTFFNQFENLDIRHIVHTPIYKQTLYYNQAVSGSVCRKDFINLLEQSMDSEYLERINALSSLPPAVPSELWEQTWAQAQQLCTNAACEALQNWMLCM